MDNTIKSITTLAKLCHETIRAYCISNEEQSIPCWDDAPDYQKESTIQGVINHLKNDLTPEESHDNWCEHMYKEGWKYGLKKDTELKEHPHLVPYKELSSIQKSKDYIFKAICDFHKS